MSKGHWHDVKGPWYVDEIASLQRSLAQSDAENDLLRAEHDALSREAAQVYASFSKEWVADPEAKAILARWRRFTEER